MLCMIFGTGVLVNGKCVWHYVDSFNATPTPADYSSWWITIAFVVVGLLSMVAVFKLIEAKEVIENAPSGTPTIGEVVIQGGRVVQAWKAEKQDKRNKEKHDRVERQIDVKLDEIIKRKK